MGSYCSNRSPTGHSSSSTTSDASVRSKSTAPTIYSDRPTKPKELVDPYNYNPDPKDSVSTYSSTIPSLDELPEEPVYDVIDRAPDCIVPDPIPSNPSTFGHLFPSSRRLLVRHDDTTIDGNMNLRVDTMVSRRSGRQSEVTLFHLRMYDLHSRRFSFRRYCRDSGREICHSVRKPIIDKNPLFRQPWGNVLASLRPGSSGDASTIASLKRRDSGYKSGKEDDLLDDHTFTPRPRCQEALGDTISLEFSNYAHVELKRRGAEAAKRYEYEYWSTKYQWRQRVRKEGDLREVSYYLVNMQTSQSIAHIVPEILTPMEAAEEKSKGGWIPPSSMWISDSCEYETMPDIAE